MEKTKRKTLALIGSLFAIAMVAVAYATAYCIIQWQISATVATNPDVCFVDWSDGTTKANNFTYSVNIFPSIITTDENITYGLWNWDTSAHNCYVRLNALTTTTNINYFNLTVYNSTTTITTNKWTSFASLPSAYSTVFAVAASTQYAIWVEINATASASGSSTFTIDVKVNDP